MANLSLKQHNELVQQLASEVEKCSKKHEEAKRLHKNAVELRAYFFPEESTELPAPTTPSPSYENRRRFRKDDYYPHITQCLVEKGTASYKEIHSYLVQAMNAPLMTVVQVNKFLNQAISKDPECPFERDAEVLRGGNFKLKGHGGVPPVARPLDADQAPNVSPSKSEIVVA